MLTDDCVVCRLFVRIGGDWVGKEDVGSPSEQPDDGDKRKASYSDALKRAAVKFGIGRYSLLPGRFPGRRCSGSITIPSRAGNWPASRPCLTGPSRPRPG